jgi:hypothetical protein
MCYSADFVIKILCALIQKIQFELEGMKRRAYAILNRFVRLENLWVVFLRTRNSEDFPAAKKERTVKIFTALLKIYESEHFISSFFDETGRHFMSLK